MIHDRTPCSLNISAETLSAWRSQLLSTAELERLGDHIPTCAACQRHLQRFERIAQALRAQHVPPSGNKLWRGVQTAMTTAQRQPIPLSRRFLFGSLSAFALVVMLFVVFTTLGHNRGNQPPQTATSMPSASATLTAIPGQGTIKSDCSNYLQEPNKDVYGNIPLPPGSLIGNAGAAAGTYYEYVCTPNGTAASIDAFMNSALARNGWTLLTAANTPPCLQGKLQKPEWLKNTFVFIWAFSLAGQETRVQGPPTWVIEGNDITIFGCK